MTVLTPRKSKILPVITAVFREKYPITDTWAMPAIGTGLVFIAAVINVLCLWWWRERSVLNIVLTVLTVPPCGDFHGVPRR
ncbi:MAG: hypothetical protein JW967_01470 [Dehalococcoidales bacterium]|nr:hypothetical protein [Dehalococcoidales bacterium]